MRISLRVQTYCEQAVEDPREQAFDTLPVVIGRSPTCDYVLSDTTRYISARHATISVDNGRLMLQDTSSNGVFLNGSLTAVGRGNSAAIASNETFAIGDYLVHLTVLAEQAASPAGSAFDDMFEPNPAAAVPPAMADPFPAPAPPAQAPAYPAAQNPPPTPAAPAPQAPPPVAEPYDPFRGDEPDWAETPVAQPTPVNNDGQGDSYWPDWTPAAPEAPASPPPAARPAATPEQDPFAGSDDWLPGANYETVAVAPEPHAPTPPPAAPRPAPPAAVAPAPAPAQQAPVPQAPSPQALAQAEQIVLQRILAAAGLTADDVNSTDPDALAKRIGRLMKLSVHGVMLLLSSRNEMKNLIRSSDVTQLTQQHNNPLKFSHKPEDALRTLLSTERDRSYMAADDALDEAINDLTVHQIAMLEGMKAAVEALLEEFDPRSLEKTLQERYPVAANIPLTREARLWEVFQENYATVREDAMSDFNDRFGREFRQAYQQRVRKRPRKPDF